MNGKDYEAIVLLRTRDGVVARPGERCDHVPSESLGWLLRDGRIKPVTAKAPKKTKAEASDG